MKTYKITLIVLLALFAISCNNSSKNQTQEEAIIELNEGQKWIVNEEMSPFILEAEQILMQYDGSNFENLAEQLENKNKGLIKSCTMDGKSHDELHKWLLPHMQLIEALDDAESKSEADKIITQIKSSFQTYHTYFK